MTPRDRQILAEFSEKVREQFPHAKIWAFGSRARGESQPDSDLDICVVLETLDRPTWETISRIAWAVGFEHDILITTVKYSRKQFEQGPQAASPLVHSILREGVPA